MADPTDEADVPKRFSPFLRQLYVVTGVALYAVSTGCVIGYPAVLLPQLRASSHLTLTPHSESWIASTVGFAILNGILIVPIIIDRLGRRITNLLSVLPGLAGWCLILLADNITILIIARYLQGVSMGIQGLAAPVSIGEYTSPANRGAFLGMYTLSLAFGMLCCHVAGTFLSWKSTALLSMSFSVVSLLVITTSPETPAWLISKGKHGKCRESFTWLRGNVTTDKEELEVMIKKQLIERKDNLHTRTVTMGQWFKIQVRTMQKKEFYKPAFIMLILFILLQFSGTNVIPAYSVIIMKAVTGESVSPYTGMLVLDATRFITSSVSCLALRRYNRRSALFVSSIISTVSVSIVAANVYCRDHGYLEFSRSWIAIVFMITYVIGLTWGIHSLPFAILGEIFPLAHKSLGSCISGVFLSASFFGSVKSSPYMFLSIGVHGAFIVYAMFIVICTTILYFVLPETKGRTLQEIEDYFKGATKTDAVEMTELNEILKNNRFG